MSEETSELSIDDVRMTLEEAKELKNKLNTVFEHQANRAKAGYTDSAVSAASAARIAQTLINLDTHIVSMRLIK